jgi:DNA-binding protein
MSAENESSDAEEILSEFKKTHEIESPEEEHLSEPQAEIEPQAVTEPQAEAELERPQQIHDLIIMGTKPIMLYVSAILAKLASLPIVTIAGRGRRITQAIDVSQMIIKRMKDVGYEISDVRISSDLLESKDGRERPVSKIEIDIKKL